MRASRLSGAALWIGLVALGPCGRLAGQAPAPAVFHVSTRGNDQNPGTAEKPFATLERARDAAHAVKREQAGRLRPVSILVHGGTYTLAAPLVLTPEDSGTADCPVTFAAAPGEKPVLTGGRRITGWHETTVAGKRLWAADLPEVRAGKWYFHQFWVNGRWRVRARSPNQGYFRIAALPGAGSDPRRPEGNDRFQYGPGDMKAWDNLQDVEVVALHLWVGVRLRVDAVDENQPIVRFAARSHQPLADGPEPARYFVENALELLDAPGEWYLNRKTGVLFYWPLPGESMTEVDAVAPVLPHLLRFDGKPEAGRFVEHVVVRGLTFMHSEWWPARGDPVDEQAAVTVPAAVQGDGLRHCTLTDCTVAHVGTYAVHLAAGCRENRVVGCDVFDLGAGGIMVGEQVQRDDPARQTGGNALTDNHIHDAGQVFPQAVGIWVGQSGGNRIAHNHIHDLFYTGISCGWTWGYGKTLARDNVIEFNDVHDLGKGVLSDMGGVYTLGVQPGTVIRGNVFHDIAGYRYGGWGIYFDEGTTGIVAENNLVYRTTHGGFHQHYGRENVVRNNILAYGRAAQLQRSRAEPHLSFTFEHNIVYYGEGNLLAGTWDDGGVALDHNLYWRTGGGVRFGDRRWKQWRGLGGDRHSGIADPLFVAPERGDFRLKPGSPAAAVGFTLPDFSGVGPRPESARGTTP
jgi:hypothetical protein